jgi:coenzyme F420-0:L-glutamate ligase/coenzyme F420-1:gamma-L-glutamate ligase
MNSLTLTALPGIPLIQQGDDLALVIYHAAKRANVALMDTDVLVVTSKIVAKAEGRRLSLSDVVPGEEAQRLAAITGKDARMVEMVLRESTEVSRAAPNVLVVRHRLGFVSANAGIDQSNVAGDEDSALLLPLNPDASAARIRDGLQRLTNAQIGVVLSDSHGRPFRMGNVGVAVGVAGIPALRDLRGSSDLFGRALRITIQGYADMIASAAGLVSGEGAEGLPVIHIRGLIAHGEGKASDLNRPAEQDLYRSE